MIDSDTFEINNAWKLVMRETRNAPRFGPYSAKVVCAREFLLIAQNLLSLYENEKSFIRRTQLAGIFIKTMSQYRKTLVS